MRHDFLPNTRTAKRGHDRCRDAAQGREADRILRALQSGFSGVSKCGRQYWNVYGDNESAQERKRSGAVSVTAPTV
jgi:hypothetical protein